MSKPLSKQPLLILQKKRDKMLTTTDLWVLAFLAGITLAIFVMKTLKKYRGRKNVKKGIKGEKIARALLKKEGYQILNEQLEDKVIMTVQDKVHECKVRADFYVKKGMKKYIVEVKSGQNVKATLPDIRRQLLEYDLVFRPDGMLFLDTNKGVLEEVVFDRRTKRFSLMEKVYYFTLGSLFGAMIALAILRSLV